MLVAGLKKATKLGNFSDICTRVKKGEFVMGISIRTVAKAAELLAGKSMGVVGEQIGKNTVTYLKTGNQILKTVTRPNGVATTGIFEKVGGKYVVKEAAINTPRGLVNTKFTDLGYYRAKSTTVSPINGSVKAECTAFSNGVKHYGMIAADGSRVQASNNMVYNGLFSFVMGK